MCRGKGGQINRVTDVVCLGKCTCASTSPAGERKIAHAIPCFYCNSIVCLSKLCIKHINCGFIRGTGDNPLLAGISKPRYSSPSKSSICIDDFISPCCSSVPTCKLIASRWSNGWKRCRCGIRATSIIGGALISYINWICTR